jgi:hypothetical protein
MARKLVVELYDTDKGRRSNTPASAVCTQWDSRDSVPTGRETTIINSAHTYTGMEVFSPLLFASPINQMRWLPSSICFLQRANLIGQSLKKSEAMEARQNRRFYFEFLPFGSPIYVKGAQQLPKHMG